MLFFHGSECFLVFLVLMGLLKYVSPFSGNGCLMSMWSGSEHRIPAHLLQPKGRCSMSTCARPSRGTRSSVRMNNEELQPRSNEIKFDAAARYRKAFPLGVNNVLDQVGESLNLALDDGLFRLRVQLNIHQFDQRLQSFSDGKMPELVAMIGELLVERGMRPSIMFNTIMDASIARTVLPDHLREKVSINVLGLGEFGEEYDAAVLVAPSNEGNENLQRIEAVEKLIYSGPPRGLVSRSARAKYMQRPIILINPVLEAIHSLSTPHVMLALFVSSLLTSTITRAKCRPCS